MFASEAAAALRFFAWRHANSPILHWRALAQPWGFEFRRQDLGDSMYLRRRCLGLESSSCAVIDFTDFYGLSLIPIDVSLIVIDVH